jgi:hypothetical protein
MILCIGIISGCGAPSQASSTPTQQSSPAAAHSFQATVKTLDGAFRVTLAITPDSSGPNVFTVHVQNTRTGQPLAQAVITLYFTMQTMLMGTDSITLRAQGNGRFSAASGDLSMAGRWAIGMTIQTPDRRIHKAGVSLVTS